MPSFPYSSKAPYFTSPNVHYSARPNFVPYTPKFQAQHQKVQEKVQEGSNNMEQNILANNSRFEENERLKYLSICKQIVQQFNSKLSKIQH